MDRPWVKADSGDWFEPQNWYYWGRPDTSKEVANFGSAAESASTVTVDEALTIQGLRFRNANTYTLDGSGDLTFEADSGNSGEPPHFRSQNTPLLACPPI